MACNMQAVKHSLTSAILSSDVDPYRVYIGHIGLYWGNIGIIEKKNGSYYLGLGI